MSELAPPTPAPPAGRETESPDRPLRSRLRNMMGPQLFDSSGVHQYIGRVLEGGKSHSNTEMHGITGVPTQFLSSVSPVKVLRHRRVDHMSATATTTNAEQISVGKCYLHSF